MDFCCFYIKCVFSEQQDTTNDFFLSSQDVEPRHFIDQYEHMQNYLEIYKYYDLMLIIRICYK